MNSLSRSICYVHAGSQLSLKDLLGNLYADLTHDPRISINQSFDSLDRKYCVLAIQFFLIFRVYLYKYLVRVIIRNQTDNVIIKVIKILDDSSSNFKYLGYVIFVMKYNVFLKKNRKEYSVMTSRFVKLSYILILAFGPIQKCEFEILKYLRKM